MSTQDQLQKAVFKGSKGRKIEVHFNPVSLRFTIENGIRNQGSGDRKKQYITQRTGKLTMELVFDTTHTGEDVRNYTGELASFMKKKKRKKNSAEEVNFSWGAYSFDGMMESYKENIDFFSATGVPLRATATVVLAGKDKTFDSEESGPTGGQGLSPDAIDSVEVPTKDKGDQGTTDVGRKAGDSSAGRAIAEANGVENPRFPEVGTLVVSGAVPLKSSAAFAASGAGMSAGVSSGLGARLGFGGVATVGVGAKMSAGVSANEGAFAGLRMGISAGRSTAQLDVDAFLEIDEAVGLATDANASFDVSGQANIHGAASLSADVGAAGQLQQRIEFDEE